MRDAVRTGLTAEAAVERVPGRNAPARAAPGRSRSARTRARFRRSGAAAAAPPHRRQRRSATCRANASPGGAQHGAGRASGLWPRESAGAWRWKTPRPRRMSPSSARSMGLPLVRRWKASPTARARRLHRGGRRNAAKCICARPAEIVAAFEEKRALRDQAQARFRRRPRSAGRHPRRRAIQSDDECGPAARHAASEGIRRRRHRPVPHRTAIHDRRDHAAAGRPDAFYKSHHRRGGRQAGGVPHARSGRRQGPALCPLGARRKSGAGLARDPHRARSSGAAALPDARAAGGVRRQGAAACSCRWSATSTNSTAPAP